MGNLGVWIGLGVTTAIVFGIGSCSLSVLNTEARNKKNVEAQQVATQAVFDRVWKVIKQQANVTEEYSSQFKEIYSYVMSGSTGGSKNLLGFIQSVNPQFSPEMHSTLMTSIEANRRDFERENKKLIDLDREHDTPFATMPSSWILSLVGREETNIIVVTSGKTEKTFETGEENNIDLFENDG